MTIDKCCEMSIAIAARRTMLVIERPDSVSLARRMQACATRVLITLSDRDIDRDTIAEDLANVVALAAQLAKEEVLDLTDDLNKITRKAES